MPDVELRTDYDHDGRLTGSQPEYDARAARPGAVLVVNNDVDQRRFPDRVMAGSPLKLDYDQPTKSGGDDELLALEVRVNNPAAISGKQLLLRVGAALAVRTRIYDDRGVILQTPDAANPGDHPLPAISGNRLNLTLELRACPGSPFAHAITLDTVFTPDNTDEINFMIQLIGRDAAGSETVFDTGTFSAAPILMLDNGVTATRLYICDNPDTLAALTDVRAALPGLGDVQLITVPQDVSFGDTWLQDQFQPGIIVGGDGWRHAIVHMPRMRSNFVGPQSTANLAAFVTSHFPAQNVGLVDDFWSRELTFSDAAGQRITLPFRDCIRLSNLMSRLTALVNAIDTNAVSIDRSAQRHTGSWSELRQQLPQIVDDFAQRANNAKRYSTPSWNATLDSMVRDAQTRAGQIQSAMPRGTMAGAFTLTVANQSFELVGELADRIFRNVQQMEGSANYGGNIESAPPTRTEPLGRIVVGNATIKNEFDHIDPDVLRFLSKQKQRVMEVDSTWLNVGHVDEMLTFVPDRHGSGVNFAVLRAVFFVGSAICL